MRSSTLNMTKNSFTEGLDHQSAFAKSLNMLEEKLYELGHKLKPYGETIEETLFKVFQSLPQEVQHSLKNTQGAVQNYYHTLASTSTQELFDDLKQFRVTPATVTVVLATIGTIAMTSGSLLEPADNKVKNSNKPKSKRRKSSKAQKANKQIQLILDHFEEAYVPQIDEYLEQFSQLAKEEQQYKYNYFEEMLLVELMKLDNVNVTGNDILRANRKKVIRFIQDHQKRLDTVKKNLK